MKVVVLVMKMALAAMFLQLAAATDHTVGSPGGSWDLQTDLRTWAESKKFIAGDSLIFQYPAMHNVFEVSKTDYDSCTTSSPMMTDSSGNTIVSLKTAGKRYFICGIPGHCGIGMKMEVDINPVNPPSPRAFPSPPPPSSSTPFKPPPIPFKPPPSSSTPFKPPPIPFNPPPFPSTPFKQPPFPSTPFKPPPSFFPKTPSSKVFASPPSSSTPSKSPSPAMTPTSSPYKGPASPVGSPSLPTTSASEKRGNIQPILGVSIAMVLIATYGF